MTNLYATIALLLGMSTPAALLADTHVEKCAQKALSHVLRGQNIAKYVDIENIARTIAGPQWKGLSDTEKAEFTEVVLVVMTAQIQKKAGQYAGTTVSDIVYQDSNAYAGKLDISGKIGSYYFEAIAEVSTKKCIFFTLNVEDMFRLNTWLGRQNAVQEKMRELGMIY